MSAERYVEKARKAGDLVEFHRSQMAANAEARARHILRATEEGMSRVEVASALGVSLSTVHKAISIARDAEGRRTWKNGRTEEGPCSP